MAGLDGLAVIAVLAAVVAALVGRRAGAAAAGGWAALLILGQAATLRLIDAGPVVGYQHYRMPGEWDDPLAVTILTLQLALVGWGAFRRREWLGERLRALPFWKLALIALVVVGLSVAPSADPRSYVVELTVGGAFRLLALANVVVLWASLPADLVGRLADRWADAGADRGTPRIDRPGLVLAAAVTALCAVLALTVYERHPHLPDEVSYLFQARYFAEGTIDMPIPPTRAAFDVDLMSYEDDRWFSPVPPGWGVLLAMGVLLGVPWLVNPILAGIGALLAYSIGWRLYDRRTGMLTAGLLAVSPWYLFLGMSLMTHLASFVAAAGATAAMLRWREVRRPGWLFLAGALVGGVALVRPLEAVVVGGLLGVAVLWLARRDRPVTSAAALGLGAIAVTSVLIPYHIALTGSATTFPINDYVNTVYEPGANALGFGANRGLGWTGLDPFPGHGARDVVVNAVLNGGAVDVELFGWATGAWFLLLAAVLVRRPTAVDRWVIAAFLLPIAIHVPYWFAGGPDFGARYWFMIILPAMLLGARGLSAGRGEVPARTLVVAATMVFSASATFMPWRAVDKYDGYRGMRPWAREIASDPDMSDALVLVRGDRQPDFAGAVIYNPLDLSDQATVFAWYRDEAARDSAVAAFPAREVWVVDGPTVTGGDVRLRRLDDGASP